MHNTNPGTSKNDNFHQKSIFSYNVYRTHNQERSHLRNTINFKSSSVSSSLCKDPEILYFNEKILRRKSKCKKVVKECSTQTSKTILQLAQIENEAQPECETHKNTPQFDSGIQIKTGIRDVPRVQIINEVGMRNFNRNQIQNEVTRIQNIPVIQNDLTRIQNIPVIQNDLTRIQNIPVIQNVSEVQNIFTPQNIPVIQNVPVNLNITRAQNMPGIQNLKPQTLSDVLNLCGTTLLPDNQHIFEAQNRKNEAQNPKPEIAQIETGRMSPDSLAGSPRECSNNYSLLNCPYSIANRLSDYTLDGSCHEQDCLFSSTKKRQNCLDKPLTQTFLENNRSRILDPKETFLCFKRDEMKSRSFIENFHHPNYIQEPPTVKKLQASRPKVTRRSCKSLDLPDNSFVRRKSSSLCYCPHTFMCPTTASTIKSKMADIQSANLLIPPMRRGRSTSPKASGDKRRLEASRKIPYIDQSKSDISSSTTLINATRHPELLRLKGLDGNISRSEISVRVSEDVLSLITNVGQSNSSVDNTICVAVNRLREPDWRIALRGLAEIVEICRVIDVDLIYDYMNSINQRLIELLKSPRSHVCRTACQAAGHLFEYVKDTRRPEFDDVVDLLLHKTADANKFIRHDANLALDCMVTHISTFNAVRALCTKGPFHKNPLVRCATVRLLVCAIVIVGPDFVLNPNNNEYTRKRIILNMARFLEDRNLETRKLAERLYKVLCKEPRFDVYLKKYLEKEQIVKIKKTLRLIHKK